MDTALTGSQAREGVAARLLLVRLALRSRGGDPDLAAGGPTKRNRTTGGQRDGQWEGEALTGRTSGSPTSRRPVVCHVGTHPCIPVREPHHCMTDTASVPPMRRLAVSPGMVWARREHSDARTGIRWIQNMAMSIGEDTACAAMGCPMSLSRYLDLYPVLFRGVSVSQ